MTSSEVVFGPPLVQLQAHVWGYLQKGSKLQAASLPANELWHCGKRRGYQVGLGCTEVLQHVSSLVEAWQDSLVQQRQLSAAAPATEQQQSVKVDLLATIAVVTALLDLGVPCAARHWVGETTHTAQLG